jgi:hypothetical protein
MSLLASDPWLRELSVTPFALAKNKSWTPTDKQLRAHDEEAACSKNSWVVFGQQHHCNFTHEIEKEADSSAKGMKGRLEKPLIHVCCIMSKAMASTPCARSRPGSRWRPEEDELLIKLAKKRTYKEIACELPGRSHRSCAHRFSRLRRPKKRDNPKPHASNSSCSRYDLSPTLYLKNANAKGKEGGLKS